MCLGLRRTPGRNARQRQSRPSLGRAGRSQQPSVKSKPRIAHRPEPAQSQIAPQVTAHSRPWMLQSRNERFARPAGVLWGGAVPVVGRRPGAGDRGGAPAGAYVGMSLYTWTAIIAVVLAGFSIGHWVGGRLADTGCDARAGARRVAVALALASASSLAVLALLRLLSGPLLSAGLTPVLAIVNSPQPCSFCRACSSASSRRSSRSWRSTPAPAGTAKRSAACTRWARSAPSRERSRPATSSSPGSARSAPS